MVVGLVGGAVIFNVLSGGIVFRPMNVNNFILQNAYLFVLAPGMMLVMLTGRIDLSVGSVAGFAGALAGVFMVRLGYSPTISVLAVLAIGVIIGAFHGVLIAYARMPMFVVTLAGMLIWRGLTLALLGGKTITPFPSVFMETVTGYLPGSGIQIGRLRLDALVAIVVASGIIAHAASRRLQNTGPTRQAGLIQLAVVLVIVNAPIVLLGLYRGIPTVLLAVTLILGFYWYLTAHSVVGRRMYATGAAVRAARLSGVDVRRQVAIAYTHSGFLAAFAGVVVAGRLNAVTAKAGNFFEIDAIVACLAGGVSAAGGIGTLGGVVFGALTMGILHNGMSVVGVGGQDALKALILLVIGYLDVRTREYS
jgi:putative multiple sugar transport system permease protein